jgi:N-acetylmuramoyl-L-alanine amidase
MRKKQHRESGNVRPADASFADGAITTPVPVPAAPRHAAATPGQPAIPAAVNTPAQAPPTALHFYAVIDPSHGGDDRGAALSDAFAEKDVTLALARRLRQEFESRGIPTLVLRDSDANMALDDRAARTNTANPTIYVLLHAASDGKGVRLYTSLLPAGGENNGPFVAWEMAQARFVPISKAAAQNVAAEFQRQIPVRTLQAPSSFKQRDQRRDVEVAPRQRCRRPHPARLPAECHGRDRDCHRRHAQSARGTP